jgi:hypothetical protein
MAGQTTDLQQWQNSSGTVLTSISSTGKVRVNTATTADALAQVLVSTGATTNKALVLQGIASQTANLQEWQDSSGTVLASISSAGKCTFAAATTSAASLNLPHGTAPTVPVNGDVWTTTAGVYAHINGTTLGIIGGSLAVNQVAFGSATNTISGASTLTYSAASGLSSNRTAVAGNEMFGSGAGNATMTGTHNTAIGNKAFTAATGGVENVAVGTDALLSGTNASYSVAVGYRALSGVIAGAGTKNTAIGHSALRNTTVGQGTAVGYSALYQCSTGANNTGIGHEALFQLLTGANNTAIGHSAGYNAGVSLTTVANCTFVGYQANSSVNAVSNSTAIGNGAQVTASNQVVIGNASVTETILRGTVLCPTFFQNTPQAVTANATITSGRVKFTGSTAGQTLTLPAGVSGTDCFIRNAGSVAVTIARAGSNTIEGATTFVLEPGEAISLCFVTSDWTVF